MVLEEHHQPANPDIIQNMIFNVMAVLTNNFKNIFTFFTISGLISVCLRVDREFLYHNEMDQIHFEMSHDGEFFANVISIWRFRYYKITVSVFNEAVNSTHHENRTIPSRFSRPYTKVAYFLFLVFNYKTCYKSIHYRRNKSFSRTVSR